MKTAVVVDGKVIPSSVVGIEPYSQGTGKMRSVIDKRYTMAAARKTHLDLSDPAIQKPNNIIRTRQKEAISHGRYVGMKGESKTGISLSCSNPSTSNRTYNEAASRIISTETDIVVVHKSQRNKFRVSCSILRRV